MVIAVHETREYQLNQKQQRAVRRLRSQMRPYPRRLLHFIQMKNFPRNDMIWTPFNKKFCVIFETPIDPEFPPQKMTKSETVKNSE